MLLDQILVHKARRVKRIISNFAFLYQKFYVVNFWKTYQGNIVIPLCQSNELHYIFLVPIRIQTEPCCEFLQRMFKLIESEISE